MFLKDTIWALSIFAVWAIAFFSVAVFDFLYLDESWKKVVLFLGVLTGFLLNYFNIISGISSELLGILAFVLAIFLAFDKDFRGKQLLLIFCSIVIFYSFNLAIIITALLVFFMQKIWLNRSRKMSGTLGLLPASIVLLVLLIWGILHVEFSRDFGVFLGYVINLLSDLKLILLGVGDGRLLQAIINYSGVVILPSELYYHEFGLINSFYEKGLLLILVLFVLIWLVVKKLAKFWSAVFFIIFWFFTLDFLQNPNGIFMAIILLFAGNYRGK